MASDDAPKPSAPAVQDDREYKRVGERVRVRFRATYRARSVEGSGFVRNISHSGALIDPAEPPLLAGGQTKLRFSFFEDSLPVEVKAEVVRETKTGFAVRFTEMDPRVRGIIKQAISRARSLRMPGDDDDEERTLLDLRTGTTRE
jgi:hypothetical protein